MEQLRIVFTTVASARDEQKLHSAHREAVAATRDKSQVRGGQDRPKIVLLPGLPEI
jgi:hypothetical protein